MADNRSLFSSGLRTKLSLGFVGLLAILIAVGVESISLLSDLGGSIDVILRENYRSVIASEQMKEALERLDSGALFALSGEVQQGRDLARENRLRFEAALQTELHNITLPGEGERAERLRQLYDTYVPTLERILAAETPAQERHTLYFERLYPVFQQVKTTANEILEMNQQNMVAANDRARKLAARASRSMAVMLLAGVAFAGFCVYFLSRSILGPLERLTWAARKIEGGDLDTTVAVTSDDEVGALGAAFNAMAAGLRELRETDQAHLLRARRVDQLALDSLPEAVAVLSMDRRVEVANRAAVSLLGLQPGEAIPEGLGEWLLPLLDKVESGHLVERVPAMGIRLSSVEGERYFLTRAEVLRDQHDRPDGFVLVVEDVSDRRRGSEVHAAMLENAARDLQAAQGQAERCAEIAANLLGMARLEERRGQLHLAPAAPGDLIGAAIQRVSAAYREEQVDLVSGADAAAGRVLVDREGAELVLTNLLRNALAHSHKGGVVTLRAEPVEGRVRFTVTDTGSGIPAAYRERIFEPFHQVPGTEELGGAGIGLAMARDIVQAHGGEIHYESEEGRGTTFWLTFPAAVD